MSEPDKPRMRYRVALTGVVLYVALDAVAQLLPPHYSPLSQPESDLAVGPFGFVMAINFLNRGLLSLEFMFALLGTIRLTGTTTSGMRGGAVFFGVWSFGSLLLALFPTDVPPTPVSWHGAIHLLVAVLAFLGGAFGALALSLRMRGSTRLEEVRRFALPLAIICVVLCLTELVAPFFFPRLEAHFGGLLERVFLGSVLLWMALVSAAMLRSGPRPGTRPAASLQ